MMAIGTQQVMWFEHEDGRSILTGIADGQAFGSVRQVADNADGLPQFIAKLKRGSWDAGEYKVGRVGAEQYVEREAGVRIARC